MFKDKEVKKAEKIYMEKKAALISIIFLVFICSPIMIALFAGIIFNFINGEVPVVVVLLLFLLYVYWILVHGITKYSSVLFQEQNMLF